MTKIFYQMGKKIVEPVGKNIPKAANKVVESVEHCPAPQAIADSGLLRSYNGIKGHSEKLFKTLEEFTQSVRKRFEGYKDVVPDRLYQMIEKGIQENNFEFSKILKEYYSELNNCKTMEEVHKLYPEFKSIQLKPVENLKNELKAMLPENICTKIHGLKTDNEKMEFIMSYFDKVISDSAKKWEAYPEFLKYQRQIAEEVISGSYRGNSYANNLAGVKYYNNPQMPVQYQLLGVNTDELLIDILKQVHLEGKNITDVVVKGCNGRDVYAKILQKNGIKFVDRDFSYFRRFLSGAEKNAKEFAALGNLSKEEISSAVLIRTWSTSHLRSDFQSLTKFGKGWSNIKYILQKEKYPEFHAFPSERIIESFLLQQFKISRVAKGGNPFKAYENPQKDVFSKIRSFVNRNYSIAKLTPEDRRLLSSREFLAFKEQYDLEGMKKSWEMIEQQYKNIFFKYFWTPERVERFTKSLNESYDLASKNIKISDEFLSKAMLDVIE